MRNKTKVLAHAISSVLLAAAGSAAMAGQIDGRVLDNSEKHSIAAARITIDELNRVTRSGFDGRFTFNNVPPGSYTLSITYVGAQTITRRVTVTDSGIENVRVALDSISGEIEDVFVYGQASRTATALNKQRAADNLISVISSDAANNLPDNNIAEALQRAAGVAIERDQGEGRFVSIRGLAPSLNTVQINGVNVPAPDSGERAVALDVIPSELLENLEISKSFTPEQDGDAIGGTINVRSLTGFDRDGAYWRVTAEGSYNDLEEESSPSVSGVYTNTFSVGDSDGEDNVAVAFAISYEDREFGSDNLEHDGGWVEEGDFFWPEEPELRNYQVTRERMGMTFNLDFRPNASSSYYLRTLYSDFEDAEIRNRIEVKPDEDALVSLGPDSGVFSETEFERSLKDRIETQEILSVVIGGENLVGAWTIDYKLGYSRAEEEEPNRVDTEFQGGDYAFSWSALGETPNYSFGPEKNLPSEFELDELVIENNLVEDEEVSLAINLARPFEQSSFSGEIKFGAKYRSREKDRSSDILVYDDFESIGEPDASGFVDSNPDYGLSDFGFGLDGSALRSLASTLTADNLNADESLVQSTVGDYSMEEDIFGAYVQATFDFDRLRAIAGVRYEQTDFSASGFRGTVYESDTLDLEANGFSSSSQDGDYDYLMPAVVLRYELNDETVLRAAASQTIARPSFGALNPSSLAEIEEEDGETEFAIEDLGNNNLDPYESFNLDFGAEYYPGGIGVMSAAFFYKNVENFIAQTDVSDSLDLAPWLASIGLTEADVTDVDALQFQNGGDADLYGVELAYVKNFDSGFLISANATFTDSEADFEGRTIDLPQSAGEVANLVIGYENYGFEARLAVNYTGERLLVVGGDSASDVFQDTHNQIDLSLKYNVSDRLQVYFNAINLTDEPFYLYQGNRRYNFQYEEYGFTMVAGITFTSF